MVVIDVLRQYLASLINGCKEVIPAIVIEEVINMSKNCEKDSTCSVGEKHHEDGFHLPTHP